MKTKEDVLQALSVISDYSNGMGNNDLADIMTKFMMLEHRTLQQLIMKSIIQLIVNYSKFNIDDRNKTTVGLAERITNFLIENNELHQDDKYFAPFI